jgi:tetratricopeptide (TPR) repeat protein
MIRYTLILLFSLTIFVSNGQTKEKIIESKNTISISKELFKIQFEQENIKKENENLKIEINTIHKEYKSELKEQKSELIERMNMYLIFLGIILSLIAWSINFFGKSAIKKRVEEIIQNTAESYAERKTNEVIEKKITKEYTESIIRTKGEPEIEKLLKELEERGKKVISDIRNKGDEVINSVWAAPPSLNEQKDLTSSTDNEIKKEKENIRADEFFNLAFNTKDPKIRIELYKNVLELEPNNWNALNNIGVAYNDTYQYDKAIEVLNKAIEINNDFGLAYANRANSYNQQDEYEKSIYDANKSIDLNPKLEWPYAIKGNVLTKQGSFLEAQKTLSKAIKINPNSAVAHFNRGFFNEETRLYDQSLSDYLKAEELGYDNLAVLYNNLAVLYRRFKDFDKAIEYIEKAKNVNPDWPNIDGTLALIYADKGDDVNFYKNLKIALDKSCPVWNYLNDSGFDKYRDSPKLNKLIEPYKEKYYA